MSSLATRLAAGAPAACALLAPATASATSTKEQIEKSMNAGVTYLKSLQKKDGSIPGFGGDWALTAFAAAGVAPADVKLEPASTSARAWYQGQVGVVTWPGAGSPPGHDFERGSLLAYAAGIDPARV